MHMNEKQLQMIPYEVLDRQALTPVEDEALEAAMFARQEAHVPYSGYKVGAAIWTGENRVVPGWNVENEMMDTVLHAGTNAIGHMSRFDRSAGIEVIAMAGGPDDQWSEEIVMPCRQCRLRLIEAILPENDPMIIMAGTRGKLVRASLKDLFTFNFFPGLMAREGIKVGED
jgi:cytidine deaminase